MTRRIPVVLASLTGVAALSVALVAGAWWWSESAPIEPDAAADPAVALNWENLVQPGFEPAPDPFIDMSQEKLDKLFDGSDESTRELAEIDEAMNFAPVNETLDGKHVTLPGYVVPLDFDGQTRLKEFLLVPYFGACIHTPPPPANQIVMAELGSPVEIADTYEPVLLRGILRVESASTDLAETGYRMQVLSVGALPDEQPAQP